MSDKEKLRELVDRIESIQREIDMLKEDMKTVYEEAKENDFDTKALRRLIAKRRNARVDTRTEQLVETYEMLLNDFN